jgi:hypothetical protein
MFHLCRTAQLNIELVSRSLEAKLRIPELFPLKKLHALLLPVFRRARGSEKHTAYAFVQGFEHHKVLLRPVAQHRLSHINVFIEDYQVLSRSGEQNVQQLEFDAQLTMLLGTEGGMRHGWVNHCIQGAPVLA